MAVNYHDRVRRLAQVLSPLQRDGIELFGDPGVPAILEAVAYHEINCWKDGTWNALPCPKYLTIISMTHPVKHVVFANSAMSSYSSMLLTYARYCPTSTHGVMEHPHLQMRIFNGDHCSPNAGGGCKRCFFDITNFVNCAFWTKQLQRAIGSPEKDVAEDLNNRWIKMATQLLRDGMRAHWQ